MHRIRRRTEMMLVVLRVYFRRLQVRLGGEREQVHDLVSDASSGKSLTFTGAVVVPSTEATNVFQLRSSQRWGRGVLVGLSKLVPDEA